MAGILDWLGGRKPSGRDQQSSGGSGDPYAELSARLGDYPPDTPLHRGDPDTLTPAQRAENLAQFKAREPERIAKLCSWLWREDIDASLVLKGDDTALAAGRKIDAWLKDWVPKRPFDMVSGDREANAPVDRWFASDRAGADLVFSFISDLARLNAAAISAARPLFAWTVVDDEIDALLSADPVDNPGNEPSQWRYHPCLVRDLRDGSVPVVFDVQLAVLGLIHQRMSPLGHPAQDQFPILLQPILEGAYFWEETEPRD